MNRGLNADIRLLKNLVTVHGLHVSPFCKGGLGGISGHPCHDGISNPP